jgi:hypothetical protein
VKRVWVVASLLVGALLLVPVKVVMKCEYSGDAGSCSDHGVSLLGTPITAGPLITVLLLIPVAIAAYIGYRFDKRSHRSASIASGEGFTPP